MRIPAATWGDLNELDIGVHIQLLCEDWNEPVRYEVGESWAWCNARTWIVITPTKMYFDPDYQYETPTETWVVATYTAHGEGELISCICIDPNTGKVVYQIGKDEFTGDPTP